MRVAKQSDFGVAVRAARRTAGLSQQELADRSGVSRKMVNEFEVGRGTPLLDNVVRIVHEVGLVIELVPVATPSGDVSQRRGSPFSLDDVIESVRSDG